MQDMVGGLIEAIYPMEEDPSIALVCNDEGKLRDMPLNRALYDVEGNIYDIISGPFFLCAAPSDSDSFASLTDEQVAIGMERFGKPALFFPTEKGGVVVVA